MNMPTDRVQSLGSHKMFTCWKDSSRDVLLVGLLSFIALFWNG